MNTLAYFKHNNQKSKTTNLIGKVFSILLLLLTQGCWISDREIILIGTASDPFSREKNIAINYEISGKTELLVRVGTSNEFLLYQSNDSGKTLVRFFNITPKWKFFGEKEYIVGKNSPRNNNNSSWEHLYVTIKNEKFTLKETLGDNVKVKSVDEITESIRSSQLTRNEAGKFEFLSETQAVILKNKINYK